MKKRSFLNFFFIIGGNVLQYFFLTLTNNSNIYFYLITFLLAMLILGKVKYYPLSDNSAMPLVFVIGCYFSLVIVFTFLNRKFNGVFFLLNATYCAMWLSFWVFLKKRWSPVTLGYFKSLTDEELNNTDKYSFTNLDEKDLKNLKLTGILYNQAAKTDDEIRLKISELGNKEIPVLKISNFQEMITGKIEAKRFKDLSFDDFKISITYAFLKRTFDIIGCLIASPFIIILMFLTALGVVIDSRGPIFFTQERTGKGDKPFKMYKFRSMRTDSEKDGAKFATTNDNRITKFGKFIRKFRLDEIPQFYNILKGDMSLIGPRPEQKVFTDEFNKTIPFYPYRHAVRPGITGWAQVSQGYAATVEQTQEKVEYDLYYIKNFSIWLDILIVLKTVRTILTGFGAR